MLQTLDCAIYHVGIDCLWHKEKELSSPFRTPSNDCQLSELKSLWSFYAALLVLTYLKNERILVKVGALMAKFNKTWR